MKICLIGAGRIGAVHAIAIASDENAKLHSVVAVSYTHLTLPTTAIV